MGTIGFRRLMTDLTPSVEKTACNGCGTTLQGSRFKCLDCTDFQLCKNCRWFSRGPLCVAGFHRFHEYNPDQGKGQKEPAKAQVGFQGNAQPRPTSPTLKKDSKDDRKLAPLFDPIGWRLLHVLGTDKWMKESVPASNMWLCPLGIAIGLVLCTAGESASESKSLCELWEKFGRSSFKSVEMMEQELSRALAWVSEDPAIQLRVSTGMWGQKHPEDHSEDMFDRASLLRADLLQYQGMGVVNDWYSWQSGSFLLPDLDEPVRPLEAPLLTLSTVFKGAWTKKFELSNFDLSRTARGRFQMLNDAQVGCPMMHSEGVEDYYERPDLQVCRLSYGRRRFNAVVILPREPGLEALHGLVASLSSSKSAWTKVVTNLSPAKLALRLPRFRVDSGVISLKHGLEQVGIRNTFVQHGEGAVSDVLHRVVCEVTEATSPPDHQSHSNWPAIRALSSSANMVCDRPFIFAVQRGTLGPIVLLGIVACPGL